MADKPIYSGVRRHQPRSALELMRDNPDEFKKVSAELMKAAAYESAINGIGWLRQVPCEILVPSGCRGGTPENPKV